MLDKTKGERRPDQRAADIFDRSPISFDKNHSDKHREAIRQVNISLARRARLKRAAKKASRAAEDAIEAVKGFARALGAIARLPLEKGADRE